jgi:hypothetical protein
VVVGYLSFRIPSLYMYNCFRASSSPIAEHFFLDRHSNLKKDFNVSLGRIELFHHVQQLTLLETRPRLKCEQNPSIRERVFSNLISQLSCSVLIALIRALGLFKRGPSLFIKMRHFKRLFLVPTFGIETRFC